MYFERKKIVKIRDFWFEDDRNKEAEKGVDFVEYHDMSEIPHDKSNLLGKAERMTLISDLNKTEEKIMSSFRKNTKYEIRRAEKEGCSYVFYHSDEVMLHDDILRTINSEHIKLFKEKGVSSKDEYTYMKRAAENGMLSVSVASLADGLKCAYHVYIVGNGYARLLHAISIYRDATSNDEKNAIGRANRFLHSKDMMEFKTLGYRVYDWGGYSETEEFKSISDFKMSFGGEKKTVYTLFYATSLIGKLTSGLVKKYRLEGFVDE